MHRLEEKINADNSLKKNILNKLPEYIINDVSKLPKNKNECTICIEEFKNGDCLITLPCLHLYHKECIENWLNEELNCPVCKFDLKKMKEE